MRETVFGKMISAEDLAKTINERDCFGIPMRVVKETIKYDLGETVSYHIEYVVKINGNDLEDTLINFLREALYLFNGQGWLVRDCKPLELDKRRIVAQFQGEPYNRTNNPLKTEIKAVTYHGLSINKISKGWRAKVVFDV